jgi:DNA-binding transcriptional ArsR family regulator
MSRNEELPEPTAHASAAGDPPAPKIEMRELTDPQTMRALTHPVRLALLEALAVEGPLTATKAGEAIGESPTTCSFHFRQLAKYGFVEEAGGGPGRQRPWRLRHHAMTFTDVQDDPESAVAAGALDRMVRQRALARMRAFYENRGSYPREWQQATGASEFLVHVTPAELRALDQAITQILMRYQDRLEDPALRPEGSAPVEVLVFGYPIRTPARQP